MCDLISCPNCRIQLDDECNFCSNCGCKIQKLNVVNLNSNNQNGIYYNPPNLANVIESPKEKLVTVTESFQSLKNNSNIKNVLKSNKDYHRHNKDAINEIESMLEQNERIIFALNGSLFIERLSGQSVAYGYTTVFNNTAITTVTGSNGNYQNGVICLSDKRTIFITNSNKMHSVRQFNVDDVIDIILDKHFKSGALKIRTLKDTFVFSILNYENALKYKTYLESLIK